MKPTITVDGEMYQLYTDGSSTGSVGDGGWGFVLVANNEIIYEGSGGAVQTTNNRMELLGVIEGLKYVASQYSTNITIEVYSDSQYVIKGLNEWFPAWETKISRGKTIKNQDLWMDIKALVDLFSNIQLKWIRGHAGHLYNERCDVLAKEAKASMAYRNGQL